MIDTIIAQCTPSGAGALALLRISGPQALCIGAQIAQLSSGKKLSDAQTHTIQHGWVLGKDKEKIDEVLFFVMHAPRTFTGEHTIEISCHNNPFIIENIIEHIIQEGARIAQAGEFSRQAVENGKLDILQAEAIKELIHAQSQESLKLSFQQLKGSFSARIYALEEPLIKTIALCEASFEFLEEEMDFSDQIISLLNNIYTEAKTLKILFDQQKQIREGIRIALIGSVNAGKSSLFNALVGKNRAIVTNIPGTTRDIIESSFYKDGKYWTIIDTAGLRKTNDIIEQEGIERSYQEARLADIVLVVIDQARVITPDENAVYNTLLNDFSEKCIVIFNKSDLPQKTSFEPVSQKTILSISAQSGVGMDLLKITIQQKVESLFAQNASGFLLNKRHFNLLCAFETELAAIFDLLETHKEYELISLHLQRALSLLSELTGKSISDKAMDTVFREFCVGK